MAKEASIAPKERINITFKPATGEANDEIELPMKVMVLGDFLQRHDQRNLIERKTVSINKNNFEEVLSKQELALKFVVPDRLRDNAAECDIPVNLNFKSMRDFEPAGIAEQIPEMLKLLKLREALVSLKGPMGNIPSFRKAIEEVLTDSRQREQLISELGMDGADTGTHVGPKGPDSPDADDKPERPAN
jgi:type VI secretion system protein ImpB